MPDKRRGSSAGGNDFTDDPVTRHFHRFLSFSPTEQDAEYPTLKQAAWRFHKRSEKTIQNWCDKYSVTVFRVGCVRHVHMAGLIDALEKYNREKS